MPIPKTELTIDFGPIAPDAPEDTPVSFTVRNERTGESWSEGQFRCPLDEKAVIIRVWPKTVGSSRQQQRVEKHGPLWDNQGETIH